MQGFTAAEFIALFAVENPNALPFTLGQIRNAISISPVLQRSNWKIAIPNAGTDGSWKNIKFFDSMSGPGAPDAATAAKRPRIPGAVNGFTDVECVPVCEAMLHALRLASRVMCRIHGSSIM